MICPCCRSRSLASKREWALRACFACLASVAKAVESQFGRPDYRLAFLRQGLVYVPLTGCTHLFKLEVP